tara:strand:+ start:92 stop:364 length:273 start_codon:yes stop_codon:yes gene_type:complete
MKFNRSPNVQEKKEWWDNQIAELTDLVVNHDYRLKDLAVHFDHSVNTISAMLHRRGLSLNVIRYRHKKALKENAEYLVCELERIANETRG